MRRRVGGIVVAVVILLSGLGFIAGGIFELVVRQTGTPATARIVECHRVAGKYHSESCTGTWVTGGRLVGGNGHVVTGTIDGASGNDVGRTIDVRLAGSRAYTTSLRIPVILLVLGLGILVVAIQALRTALRRTAPIPTP